jgi:hypothetical protein
MNLHTLKNLTKKTKTSFFLIVGITLINGSASGTAHAASDSFCNSYAKIAVTQNSKNIKNGCGFDGFRWQSNHGAHYVFCKAVDESFPQSERAIRHDMLSQCLGKMETNNGLNATPARSCKKSYSRSVKFLTKDVAKRGALHRWSKAVRDDHGKKYASWDDAINKDLSCEELDNGRYKCVATAEPCKTR